MFHCYCLTHLVFDSLQYVNVHTILSPPYLHTASHQKLLGVGPQRALSWGSPQRPLVVGAQGKLIASHCTGCPQIASKNGNFFQD